SSATVERLLNPGGALSEFGTRADLCYAMRLIEESLFQDLRSIAEIRNRVAHTHLTLDFSAPEIAKLCRAFNFLKSVHEPTPKLQTSARLQFQVTVRAIGSMLQSHAYNLNRGSLRLPD